MRKKHFYLPIFLGLLIFSLEVHAKDLGNIGVVYSIAENDLMVLFQKKIDTLKANESFEKLKTDAMREAMDRPQPVGGLSPTLSPRSFLFDTSVEVPHDIRDEKNHTLVASGTRLNPLETGKTNFTSLLFYNADNAKQAEWALKINKNLKGNDLLILVGGSVFDQMKVFQKQVYFDQGGLLTLHFGITHVPAIVTQKGNRLLIQEVLPE